MEANKALGNSFLLHTKKTDDRNKKRLAVFEPTEDLRQVGFFPIHQNANAVDATGEPEGGENGENKAADRQSDLPGRWLMHRDAYVHDKRCAEREEREGLSDNSVGVPDDLQDDD